MSDTAIADVCQRCGRALLLLHWNKQWDLVVCDNFCCSLFRTPQGHIPKNGSGPELEFNTPGAASETGGIILPLGEEVLNG